jgi:N-acetylneuraminic acid mutarotase
MGNPTPTGTVTLTGGGYTSATATLTNGYITFVISAGALAVGTDTLTVTYAPDSSSSATYNGATGTASVTVTTVSTITGVSVSCTPTSVQVNQTSQCTATVSGTGNYSSAVTWTVDSGTISATGLYTAPGTVPASGKSAITATSVQDSTKSGGASVTVSAGSSITSVSVSCAASVVPTGQTSQCSATVTGTGNYSSGVTWAVNGASGGNATYGPITAGGLYQAPTIAPGAYIVTVSATSSMDSTKSGSFSVLIAGTIASVTQPITASAGGTISLPGGDSVTIPAGDLNGDSSVTLQLTSVAAQPTNTLFGGIGPSLLMSFSPAVGGVGAAVSESRFRPNAASNATAAAGTAGITFVLQGGQGLSTTQLQNAFGLLNVNDGTNNFFSLPSSYDATANATTLTVDPSMIEPSSTLEVGIAVAVGNGLTTASLTQWDDSKHLFTNSPNCPTGSTRVLVLVHGILSDAQDSFGETNGVASCALKAGTASCTTHGPYDTVFGINYDWSQPIGISSLDMANSLDSLFSSSCSFSGTIDIEAHSEGTLVALTSANDLSPSVKGKLAHIVLVAGPIDGTPLALNADGLLTLHLNQPLNYIATLIDPEITQNQKMQLKIIAPELAPVNVPGSAAPAAQAAAATLLPQTEILAVGGDEGFLSWWGSWIETNSVFGGAPNDGVVPVASALPTDSSLPNLVRLVGNDPTTGDYPYPFDHIDLVNNQNVMSDVFKAVSGAGETAQVTLGISPQTPTVLVDQSLSITANATNILNPQVQWKFNGGTTSGTLSSLVGISVDYLAPDTPGGPFPISATLPAIIVPEGSTTPLTSSTAISVVSPVPTISSLSPSSLAVGAAPQTLTINGTGFLASSTVTYNGTAHTPVYVNADQLTISLTSSDLATAGSYPVVVTNPAPGGGSSVAVDFAVSLTNPVPAITSLAPASLAVGAPPQALTINGTGFLISSTVSFNSVAHTPTYVGASQLTISLTSADLATAGTYPVVVTNPAPGGGTSAAANFTVTNPQIANEWTWINGSSTVGALGVYGTLGVSSGDNVPGSRYAASSWVDSSGTLWLFGGYGYASTGSLDSLNDLWTFSPITGNWTWVSGSSTVSAPAVYGSEGVPATTNVPGARMYAVSWIDKNNKLWLFGGEGVGSNNVSGFLDDLWEFDPIAKTWTWVSGNSASDTPGVYGTLGQPSISNVPGSRYRSVSWIDSKGNLWLFGGDGEDSTGFYGQLNDLWEYSPSANTWTWVSGGNTANEDGVYGTEGIPATTNVPGSRRQAASWIDGSDNLWLFGGSGWNASGSSGGAPLNDLWEFNPTAKTWTWISGSSTLYTPNNTYSAIGVYGAEGVAAVGNTPGGRTNPVSWIDSSNNLWLFGGNGFDSTTTVGELNDLWEFNPSTNEWTWASGSNTANAIGAYGAQNVPTATNVPGSRDYPVGWIDNSSNLWLFGGEGYGSTKTFNLLNDLWRYQPSDTAAPSITGVSPLTFTAPLLGQTITIDGSGFQSDDTLTFSPPAGSAIPSTPGNLTYDSRSQLSYQFNDSVFVGGQGLGTWTVTVTSPGGQTSNAWNFTTVCQLCETNP